MAVGEQPLRAAELLLAGHGQIKIRPRTTGNPRAGSARFNNRRLARSRPLHARSLQQRQSLLRTLALAACDDLIGVDRLGYVADGSLIGRKL